MAQPIPDNIKQDLANALIASNEALDKLKQAQKALFYAEGGYKAWRESAVVKMCWEFSSEFNAQLIKKCAIDSGGQQKFIQELSYHANTLTNARKAVNAAQSTYDAAYKAYNDLRNIYDLPDMSNGAKSWLSSKSVGILIVTVLVLVAVYYFFFRKK